MPPVSSGTEELRLSSELIEWLCVRWVGVIFRPGTSRMAFTKGSQQMRGHEQDEEVFRSMFYLHDPARTELHDSHLSALECAA